jgi:hypothetical protein
MTRVFGFSYPVPAVGEADHVNRDMIVTPKRGLIEDAEIASPTKGRAGETRRAKKREVLVMVKEFISRARNRWSKVDERGAPF